MPRVSEFFGIAIYFYFLDHAPPHFHARYAGDEAVIAIDTMSITDGSLPPRVMGLVVEWGNLRRAELHRAWDQAAAGLPVDPIEPLR